MEKGRRERIGETLQLTDSEGGEFSAWSQGAFVHRILGKELIGLCHPSPYNTNTTSDARRIYNSHMNEGYIITSKTYHRRRCTTHTIVNLQPAFSTQALGDHRMEKTQITDRDGCRQDFWHSLLQEFTWCD